MRGRALVILVAVLLAPAAAGQGSQSILAPPALEVDAAAPVDPIEPDVGKATLSFDHRLNCDWNRALLVAAETVTIMHELAADRSGVVLSGDLTRELSTEACAMPTTKSIPFTADFEVRITSDAAGETSIAIVLASSVHSEHARSEAVEVQTQVKAAYLGLLQVDLPTAIKEVVDGRAVFDVELLNRGNALTRVLAEADAPRGVTVDLPGVVLESHAQGGMDTRKATTFTVVMNEDASREATVQVTFTPVSAKDGTPGQPVVVNVLVRDGSLLKAVESPGPVPVLIVPVLMGAVLLARRRS